jgi:archaellum biogenesis ATPase FlaH
MTWQLLIWNIFVWSFTGVMIYITQSSLWWLMLPAFFTGTQSASELVKAVNEAEKNNEDDEVVIDEATQAKMRETQAKARDLLEKFKRGQI